MGMADEVRRQQDAKNAEERRDAERAARTQAEATRVIDALIPEFVSAARELGIKPKKDGFLSKPYWLVKAGGWWNDEWSRWDGGVLLHVHTNGSWEAISNNEWKYLRSPLTEENVRATFTHFLTREAAKPRR